MNPNKNATAITEADIIVSTTKSDYVHDHPSKPALLINSYSLNNTNKDDILGIDESDEPEWLRDLPTMTSGFSLYHTNEEGKQYRRAYIKIDLRGIRSLVDNPPSLDKSEGQWLIPSSLPSRTFRKQENEGVFWMLWADIDEGVRIFV